MGNLLCSECCKASEYENLNNEEGNFHVDPGVNIASRIASEVDPKASIFEGSFLDQKVRYTTYSICKFATAFFFVPTMRIHLFVVVSLMRSHGLIIPHLFLFSLCLSLDQVYQQNDV